MLNFTSLRRGHGFAELRQDSRCESMPNQKGVNAVFKIKAKKVKVARGADDSQEETQQRNSRLAIEGLNGTRLFR